MSRTCSSSTNAWNKISFRGICTGNFAHCGKALGKSAAFAKDKRAVELRNVLDSLQARTESFRGRLDESKFMEQNAGHKEAM